MEFSDADGTSRPEPASEVRCVHELIEAHCGYCGKASRRRPTFVEPAPPVDDAADWDVDIVATFPADFDGRCAWCDQSFTRGAWIAKTSNGKYVCPECME